LAFFKVSQQTKRALPASDTNHTRNKTTQVSIPYIRRVSERLHEAFKKHQINTAQKPVNNLRGKLVKVKNKEPLDIQLNLVYHFNCQHTECSENYIGETKQALKLRASQHRRPSSGDTYDSASFT
jgi:hypothetical protein